MLTDWGSFAAGTFTSTSWELDVAEQFLKDKGGLLLELEDGDKTKGYHAAANVSWISKFGFSESEILVNRS